MRTLIQLVLLWSLVISATLADPLFESDELLSLTLTGPLRSLNRERDKSVDYASATLSYQLGDKITTLPVSIAPRGNKRLSAATCSFAPLKLVFDKDTTKGTLFAKQRRLKVVTQCSPRAAIAEQNLITEYLIYKSLNLLTPNSYQARLAEIQYIDEDGKPMHQNHAILLESTRRLAKRIDRPQLKIPRGTPELMDAAETNLISVFQFMIGNTDWSSVMGEDEQECCHNGKIFTGASPDSQLFIPYDFDLTGLVNPDYAVTEKKFDLDNIRERLYRGFCKNNDQLPATIEHFNQQRAAIVALFEGSPLLLKGIRKKKVAYIKKFYDTINNPKRVQRTIIKRYRT